MQCSTDWRAWDTESAWASLRGISTSFFLNIRPGADYYISKSLTLTSPAPPPRPSTDLDLIKFLCKDVWTAVFRKQIDNLKTNHRGTFVLSDNSFGPLRRCSLEAGKMEEARALAAPFLNFPQGVVRGSLKALGLDSEVGAEVAGVGLPSVVFVVRKTQEEGKT